MGILPRFLLLILASALVVLGFNLYNSQLVGEVTPECGDGFCTARECKEGCKADCKVEMCQDGECTLAIENCQTSQDCPCPSGALCRPGRQNADQYGCASVMCGDGLCDQEFENNQDCCQDCGCEAGYECSNNVCFIAPPRVGFSPLIVRKNLSASTLAANPFLANGSGIQHPFFTIILTNSGRPTSNFVIEFDLGKYASNKQTVKSLSKGEEVPIQWFLEQDDIWLTIYKDIETSLNVTVNYFDAQGIAHRMHRSYPFTLLSRNHVDILYGDLAYFVTPDDVETVGRNAREIWVELGNKIKLIEDNGSIQFPVETLYYGEGNPTDVLVLLASVYQDIGLEPAFVETQEGTFLWVRYKNDYVTLDTRQFGKAWEAGTVEKIPKIDDIRFIWQIWEDWGAFSLTFDPRLIPGRDFSWRDTLEGSCTCPDDCRMVVVYDLRNNGLVDLDICAESLFTLNKEEVASRDWCLTMPAGSSKELRHGWSDNVCGDFDNVFSWKLSD
ncbi:hypothetical protein GOV11_04550 [Candidatus Woesearchaeota archaeon]|nr:hypothetical protein [Candidatus Woesearchaeota archaeon]